MTECGNINATMSMMKSELLIIKTHKPQLPLDWIARPHLSGKLIEALRYKVVLVLAPAGYGKTTLVIEALRDFKKPAGWVSLDATDNIPGNFLTYFITALQNAVPAVCQPILDALQSPQPPPIDLLLTTLINSISHHEDDFVLVLDDYHTIESQAVHDAMTFIVEHLPPQVHLIIASRIDPPLPLARWRVKGEISEIRTGDLSFTIEDTETFFKKMTGIVLSEKDMAILESRTEGWVAGLKMAALSLQGKNDISGYIKAFSGSNRYILDYLAEEVLRQQPPGIKQFLLETSVLERMCGPLCDAITGLSDSQSILAQLEAANLFISPLDDERRWYRYHQLFATILHNQLVRDEPQKVNLLHRQASMWYEKEGLVEDAIGHSLRGGDNERAAVLLENEATHMLGQNRAVALLEYSSRIPEPVIMASPWLCVGFAWAALTVNKPEILMKMLSRAVEVLAESPDKLSPHNRANLQRIKGHTLSLQSFIAQAQGDMPLAIRLSEEANRELPTTGVDDLLARAVNSLNLGAYYQKTGDITKAIPLLEELIAAGRKIDYHYAVLAGLGSLAEIEMQLSRFDRVTNICNEAIEQSTRWGGAYPLPVTALIYVVLGQLNYEQNDLKGAADNLNKGIKLGENSFNLEPVLKGYLFLAKLLQAEGYPEKALEYIQHAENVGPWVVIPPEVHQLPAWKAWLALRQGNVAAAALWTKEQENSHPLAQLPSYQEEYAYLTLVRMKLAKSECQNLPLYLEGFIQHAEAQGRSAAVIEAIILKALAQDCLGETAEAVETLDQALALTEPAGYVHTFIDEGAPMSKLLQGIIKSGRHVDYATKLLGIITPPIPDQSLASNNPKTAAGLIEALSEREIEVLKLIAAGKSNKEIAADLYLAIGTIKKHTNNIFGKLGVESRTQAIARARELGII